MKINSIIKEEILIQSYLDGRIDESKLISEANVRDILRTAISRINNTSLPKARIELAGLIIGTIIALTQTSISDEEKNKLSNEIAKENVVTIDNVKKKIESKKINPIKRNFIDPQKLSLSPKGKELIKKHEGLRLDAYDIGDGKITVGYGHAIPKNKSKIKVGDKISKQHANKLFDNDISKFEEAIKRMFRQWKSMRGNDVKITQNMFDVLVSMAYNMGVTNLRNSEFIEKLEKTKNPLKVADLIKKTGLKKGFGGLKKRRHDEYNYFIQEMLNPYMD